MRVYRNDAYDSRGFSWQPPDDPEQQYESDPYAWQRNDPGYDNWNSYEQCPPCHRCPKCPPCPRPRCPYPEPECYRYPLPQPVPCPYPMPCPCPCPTPCPKHEPKPKRRRRAAFGYFASITAGGVFTGGLIPFTFADSLNRNVSLVVPNSTQVRVQVPGIYRVVYSVTTTAAAVGVFLQVLRNGTLVASSPIPIQEGVNVNEIFLNLMKGDVLSLNITGTVSLAAGQNASLLLQLIAPTSEEKTDTDADSEADSESDFEN